MPLNPETMTREALNLIETLEALGVEKSTAELAIKLQKPENAATLAQLRGGIKRQELETRAGLKIQDRQAAFGLQRERLRAVREDRLRTVTEQAEKIRVLRDSALNRIEGGATPTNPILVSEIAQLRQLPEGGGTIAADEVQQTAQRKLDATLRATVADETIKFKKLNLDPPADLRERATLIAEGGEAGRAEQSRLNTLLREQKRARDLGTQRDLAQTRLRTAAEGGRLRTAGATQLLEEANAAIGKAGTAAEVKRIASRQGNTIKAIRSAAGRSRLLKGAGIGAIVALAGLPLLKSIFGKGKEGEEGVNLSPQQQFQLALALANNQGGGNGASNALQTGRELNNIQKVLAIMSTLREANGLMVQPNAGSVF